VFLQKFEEGTILHDRHLDDFGDAMSEPSSMEAPPHATVCDGKNRRMVGTIQVLVIKTIAACPGRRTSINAAHNRRA
jgi:hypothetical protein